MMSDYLLPGAHFKFPIIDKMSINIEPLVMVNIKKVL